MIPFQATNTGKEPILITPVVALYNNLNFTPLLNQFEVEKLVEVRSDQFLERKNHEPQEITALNDDYYMHYFTNFLLDNNQSIDVFGVTAFACVIASIALHQRTPEFDLDPVLNINHPLQLNSFLEDYLFKKSYLSKILS